MALAYERLEEWEEALKQYQEVVKIDPKDIQSHAKIKELEKRVEQLNEERKK